MKIRYKKGIIENYKVERIPLPGGRNHPKIILSVKSVSDSREYEISEIFFNQNEEVKCQGLWFNLDNEGNIAKNSTLKHLLDTLGVSDNLNELRGQEVKIRPNDKNYYTIDCSI